LRQFIGIDLPPVPEKRAADRVYYKIAAIGTSIRKALKATCKGMRPRAAESWKQQESKNRSLADLRENEVVR